MTKDRSSVFLFIDDDVKPLAVLETPIVFDFDTSKLTDGEHVLRIVSKSPTGREGIRKINFTVKNGPSISVEGLEEHDIVDGVLPLMINAYDKGNQKSFVIEGSETHKQFRSGSGLSSSCLWVGVPIMGSPISREWNKLIIKKRSQFY